MPTRHHASHTPHTQNGRVDLDEFIRIYNDLVKWAASLKKAEKASGGDGSSTRRGSVASVALSAHDVYHKKKKAVVLSEEETELMCDIMSFGVRSAAAATPYSRTPSLPTRPRMRATWRPRGGLVCVRVRVCLRA